MEKCIRQIQKEKEIKMLRKVGKMVYIYSKNRRKNE